MHYLQFTYTLITIALLSPHLAPAHDIVSDNNDGVGLSHLPQGVVDLDEDKAIIAAIITAARTRQQVVIGEQPVHRNDEPKIQQRLRRQLQDTHQRRQERRRRRRQRQNRKSQINSADGTSKRAAGDDVAIAVGVVSAEDVTLELENVDFNVNSNSKFVAASAAAIAYDNTADEVDDNDNGGDDDNGDDDNDNDDDVSSSAISLDDDSQDDKVPFVT
ncbi:unnamed protein product [Ceratitis capitata]|uniref:(Mediterranean fruit fly) hypothetical protein n=1 Tax=Ceratitis capitata TaxID=7213 RepID=A0A811V2T0_CERCA|nr:unnamed protein product [Ceratitis capitata]